VEYVSISCWYFHGNFTTTSLRSAPYAWHTSHISTISLSSKTRPVQDGDTKGITERLKTWKLPSGATALVNTQVWPFWLCQGDQSNDLSQWKALLTCGQMQNMHMCNVQHLKSSSKNERIVFADRCNYSLYMTLSKKAKILVRDNMVAVLCIWQHSPSWLTHWTLKTRVKAKVYWSL
jgi:hypothetical protein